MVWYSYLGCYGHWDDYCGRVAPAGNYINSTVSNGAKEIERMLAKISKRIIALFLLVELILYWLIMTAEGEVVMWSCFISIVLCFLYALLQLKHGSRWIIAGLGFTVCADFFLVLCSPSYRLWGMACFSAVQILYAIKLHLANKAKWLLAVRLCLIAAIEAVCFVVLGGKPDALAVVSVGYYANLVMNIVVAFTRFRVNKLLPIGLVLFVMCDTVIGLQMVFDVYLPVSHDSAIYRFLFSDCFWSWFFYLPSQVLIALSSRKNK